LQNKWVPKRNFGTRIIMDTKLKRDTFDATTESPASWLLQAMQLKVAAERMDWLFKPVTEDEQTCSLMTTYRFLMGLSFENLIKGILHSQGHKVVENGKFTKLFSKHDLRYLVSKLDHSKINITTEESNILHELTPYVKWAGRYPLPKYHNDIIVQMHGSTERWLELELWEKLRKHLASISWIMKGTPGGKGYHKLYVQKPE
jgi:hypothetical protein